MQLDGKRAVITGASQGLGFAMAEAFLKEGASVTICARGAADLERAVARLEATIENPPRTQAKADVLDGRKRGLVNIDAEQGEVPGQPA